MTVASILDPRELVTGTLDAEGEPLLDMQEHLIAEMGQRRAIER